MFKKNYIVAASESLARRYIKDKTNLGMIPVTVQSLVISLYNHPAFVLDNKTISDIDSYEQDILMLSVAEKLSGQNYFKQALEIKGNRRLLLKTLTELKLTGFNGDNIKTLKNI